MVAALAAAVALAAAGGLLEGAGPGEFLEGRPEGATPPPSRPDAPSIADLAAFDPLSFEEGEEDEFLERGAAAYARPLYVFSPGGAAASAERTARFRDEIENAAKDHDVEADTLEALVLLESAGRPTVAAGDDPEGAVGLAQILPETGAGLLGMRVDLAASKRTSASLERERRRMRRARAALEVETSRRRRVLARRALRTAKVRIPRLERRRRSVDERYDPERSLDAAGRYLAIGEKRFGREDLATVSYHMGIGNLRDVIDAYVAPERPRRSTRATVARYDVSYPRLFYDSSPLENAKSYRLLKGFGDDSRSYLFRLEAAREIMELSRDDPDRLARLSRLHAAKASSEEVLRPEDESKVYEEPGELESAYENKKLVPLPNEPRRLGLRISPAMGELAKGLPDSERSLYRGMRPQALATLLFISKEVRRVAGRSGLIVTSGVRDLSYQARLASSNPEATREYSLHTTGYAFDIARRYPNERVGRAFQYALDRLRALRVIDYVYEPGAIHVTVGPKARELLPLQKELVPVEE